MTIVMAKSRVHTPKRFCFQMLFILYIYRSSRYFSPERVLPEYLLQTKHVFFTFTNTVY